MDEHGFEARLRHLEHIIIGSQQSGNVRIPKTALLKRIHDLKRELHMICKSNKAVQDFLEKYDAHAKLLDPSSSTLAIEREILTPETKLELIMAAYDDLEKFAAETKQIKELEHVVSGSEFASLDQLQPQLSQKEVVHAEQAKQLTELTQRISQAMENYNGFINTLSEIFISWDNILTTMERHVSELEQNRTKSDSIETP